MFIGNQEITKEMMPSYDNFQQNPTHLYQLKQERLQSLLTQNTQMMQQQNIQQTAPQTSQQSGRWNNE